MVSLARFVREQTEVVLRPPSTDVDAVHDTRVAIRRLRSAIRVFDLDGTLDAGLRELAAHLGEVRDLQLQRERFVAAGLDTSFLEQRLYDDQRAAERALRDAEQGPVVEELRCRLAAWAEHPPKRSDAALAHGAKKAAKKARHRLRTASSDAELHRARKAAKRARYAAELVGRTKRARRFKRVQQVLGELQDSVVATTTLRRLAAEADADQSFTLGVLYGRELAQHDRLRREAAALRG